MDGRAFLDSARHLLAAPSEANRRSAAGRLYLALLHEALAALERWGFPLPAGAGVHKFVVGHFGILTHCELLRIEQGLRVLWDFTDSADYALAQPGDFADDWMVSYRFTLAETLIDLLQDIEADPVRRADAISSIRAVFP
jgi:hypothetical protein